MANDATPYIPRNPGDLLSAGDWNQVQVDIKKDIVGQIQTAIGQIDNVPHSGDADKVDGKSLEQITQDIIQKVLEAIRDKGGPYQRIFKRLELCKEQFITHNLKASPLVDVYQLDYFLAVCARGETPEEQSATWVNFYLYHSTERRIRIPSTDAKNPAPITIDIEPTDAHVSRLKLSDLLALYNVPYTEDTDLEELETNFWQAWLPNDEFDTGQYCHSPWFEKCCGERRTVGQLHDRGDWDRIFLKWMPRKTVNLLSSDLTAGIGGAGNADAKAVPPLLAVKCSNPWYHPTQITAAPTQIQVSHYDFDTIGVRLVDTPVYPDDQTTGADKDGNVLPKLPDDYQAEIKVMLLLKV